jgi:L-rhamnonate dehydratase
VKITAIEPIVLRLPEIDTSRADGTQDAFLVRVHTDEGIVGIGEADTSPHLARMMVEMPSSHAVARGLGELLVGEDPLGIDRIWRRMFEGSSYYGRAGVALHAISAIDIALWDIAGKTIGRPISSLLGGAQVDRVPVYASAVMPGTPEDVRRLAERAVGDGYRAFKLGWGPLGRDVAQDERLVRAAHEALGADHALMIDGGQGYTVKSATELLRRLQDVGLYWLEEPFAPDDYDSYRRLSDAVATRVAAGEADSTIAPFRRLVELGHVDVLQPDIARCGGFTVARQIAELARERRVEVVPHCFSTGVLVAASLHVASTLDRPTYSEFSVADSPLAGGLLAAPFVLSEGRLAVPTGPGLGIELDEDLLKRLRVG